MKTRLTNKGISQIVAESKNDKDILNKEFYAFRLGETKLSKCRIMDIVTPEEYYNSTFDNETFIQNRLKECKTKNIKYLYVARFLDKKGNTLDGTCTRYIYSK